jgi:hypothetical protein
MRPPTSLTDKMKAQSAKSYSLPASEKGEYDHLLSGAAMKTGSVCAVHVVGGMPLTKGDA